MRIRTFTAANTQAAMTLVRAELGPSAVIIAIDETANGRGVIVRAAVENMTVAPATAEPPPRQSIEERLEALLAARLARCIAA